MYFKTVELIGFKSFPEKTKISFEPGITAIIGPNGCGKTNISDAIRWVIGETSTKTLRGQRMEDFIFNGTEVHKPLGMAEVSLTLNNEDKIIPIEYSEVTVTRCCHRSGESEYFINKTPCRLRDIQELFMDTGIGTESYSVMEQGKVDLILSSKPEDRRLVLEEAAGIAKYNARRDAALRKLELTSQNLLRIDDIIAEVKREIISIKRQVTKAEKYKESYERLKNLETSLSLKNYKAIKKEIELLEGKVKQFKEESTKLSSEVTQEESKEEVLHIKVIDIEKDLASARDEFLVSAEKVNTIENKVAGLKERRGHLKERLEKAAQDVEKIQEKILETQKRIELEEKEQSDVLENIRETESSLVEKENAFSSLLSQRENKEKEVEEYKNRLFENMREVTNLNNEIEKININLADIERRMATLNRERQKGKEGEKGIALKIDGLIDLLLEWEKAFDSFSQSISEVLKEIEEITEPPPGLISELIKIETGLGLRKKEIERLKQGIQEIPTIIFSSKQRDAQAEDISLELEELEDEKETLNPGLVQKREVLGRLEKEKGDIKEEIDKMATLFHDLKFGLENARDAKEMARLSFTSLQEKKRGMELHLNSLKERLSEYSQTIASLDEEIKQVTSEGENLRTTIEDLEKEKEEALKDKISFKERMEGLEEERKNVAATFHAEEEKLRMERASINKRLEELHRLEISMTQKEAGLSNIRERMLNLYQVDMDTVMSEPSTAGVMQVEEEMPPVRDATYAEAQDEISSGVKREIEELRQKIDAMGAVNIMAIEENKELEDRFSLFKKEREDILKAREELHQVISKIDHTCRQKFSETLEKVRVEFHQIFRILFNGGKADLILQEGDILESGIEIMARPPGKNLSTISQLSGGEKALTAIALLFALFRIRPSPFCVLDEIDAPLDDSNIGRFGALLKEFLKTTQFIIITHNKRTISIAQVIYGITMEESGISKIVSVKFAQHKDSGAGSRDSKVPAPSSI